MNSEFEGTESTLAGTGDVATTCCTTCCVTSIGPLRTKDFSSERIGHMESFQTMRQHVTVAWISKQAYISVVSVTYECRILTGSMSGRPDTIPTTRFHVPASISASSVFSKCHRVCLTMFYIPIDSSTYAQVLIWPTSILLSNSLVQSRDCTIHTRQQSSSSLFKNLVA
jgi:hypothetical protein